MGLRGLRGLLHHEKLLLRQSLQAAVPWPRMNLRQLQAGRAWLHAGRQLVLLHSAKKDFRHLLRVSLTAGLGRSESHHTLIILNN